MSDRPYRTYKGGKADLSPTAPVTAPERRGAIVLPSADAPPPIVPPRFSRRIRRDGGWTPKRRHPRTTRFWVIATIVVVLVMLVAWLALGLLAMRTSVSQANDRLDPRARGALSASGGSMLSTPTALLIIGVDENANSDSIQVVRFDPDQNLVSTLSIPRDLRVPVPGYGDEKINAAYAAGGAPLTVEAVRGYTGLDIDHVAILDFGGLEALVDAVGGVTVDNPRAIRSVFDGEMHKFPKGEITLDGADALAFSRVRKNALYPGDSDVSRGQRQQLVTKALRAKITSPAGILRLRTVAGAMGGAFATDLSLAQLAQLGWVDKRASRRLRCNLGGSPAPLDGEDVLIPDGSGNRRVLGEFLGEQAVQPAASRSMFAAQCAAS